MQAKELAKIREEGSKTKFKSRTFWLTIIWLVMVPLGIVAQILLKDAALIPIQSIVTFSGSATLLYIGGNKAISAFETSKIETGSTPIYSEPISSDK